MRVSIRELADMTWEEVRDMDRARTVALLPVGATEAHGPHLPLETDVIIARAMARAAAAPLAARGLASVVLPPLAYTAAPFAAAFPGTLSVSPATLRRKVAELQAAGVGGALLAHHALQARELDDAPDVGLGQVGRLLARGAER